MTKKLLGTKVKLRSLMAWGTKEWLWAFVIVGVLAAIGVVIWLLVAPASEATNAVLSGASTATATSTASARARWRYF